MNVAAATTSALAPAAADLSRAPRNPPGPKGLPLAGNTIAFQKDPLTFCSELAQDYGPVSHFTVIGMDWYMLTDPADVYDVLVKRPALFLKPLLNKRIFNLFLGQGVLSTDGAVWQRLHKLTQPAFHRQRVNSYAGAMVDYTEQMVDEWPESGVLDFQEHMTNVTLNIVGKTLFDADMGPACDRIRNAMLVINKVLVDHINLPLPLPTWWPSPGNRRKMAAIGDIEAIIAELVATRRSEGLDRGDLLSMLVLARDEEGGGLNDKELRDAAMTLIFAGHETTSHAMTWMWYLLASHPEVRDKVIAEIDEVVGDRLPTLEDLKKLTYLEMTLKECMRLLPSVWVFMREPAEDTVIGSYRIPKGGQIFISPYIIHRRPELFDDPLEFRPERFTPENERKLPMGAYIPFSIGPRVCQGKMFAWIEARLVIATLLRKVIPTLEPGFVPKLYPKLSLSSENGLRVEVRRR